MTDRKRKSMLEMANGAILERMDYAMGEILDNIADPNTNATAKRKVTIVVELIPDSERQFIQVGTQAKLALAPTNPVVTSLYVTTDEKGNLTAVENTPQIPGQQNLDRGEQAPAPMLRIAR